MVWNPVTEDTGSTLTLCTVVGWRTAAVVATVHVLVPLTTVTPVKQAVGVPVPQLVVVVFFAV